MTLLSLYLLSVNVMLQIIIKTFVNLINLIHSDQKKEEYVFLRTPDLTAAYPDDGS